MKKKSLQFLLILLFLIMLCFPQKVLNGSARGLLLWFNTVLPTLFPFSLISGLLIQSGSFIILSKIFSPFLCRALNVSLSGIFAVLSGFVCGCPMGAKCAADLSSKQYITPDESEYIMAFCNNISPSFLVTYVILHQIRDRTLLIPAVTLTFGVPILMSFLFRIRRQKDAVPTFSKMRACSCMSQPPMHSAHAHSATAGFFSIVEQCITDTSAVMVKIGGYIILFSVILSLIPTKLLFLSPILTLFFSMLEVTNGVALLCGEFSGTSFLFPGVMFCVSFGGFCAAAQTASVAHNNGYSGKKYITKKLATAMVTSLFALLYQLLFC